VVRPAGAADADGVADLYRGLSLEDRYHRFFSAGPGIDRFVEDWMRLEQVGGVLLVAVVREDDGTERIVADAGFGPLPDGDGELGMTVAEGWRGWLGPYLLDALLAEAAARGVPALEADVLAENTAMRRLLAARGCGLLERKEVSAVRVLLGTRDRAPDWPAVRDRPRVLVEGTHHAVEGAARELGYEVVTCPGPERGRPPCPLLAGRGCPLASGADLIVCAPRSDDDLAARLGEAHARAHPEVPLLEDLGRDRPVEDVAVAVRQAVERSGARRSTSGGEPRAGGEDPSAAAKRADGSWDPGPSALPSSSAGANTAEHARAPADGLEDPPRAAGGARTRARPG
jgi:RimJ/RimL family protein N-acetyltransferase